MSAMSVRRRVFAGLLAVILAAAIALVPGWLGRVRASASAARGSCQDLAVQVDPKKVPVDTGYDVEADVVYVHWGDRTYAMRPGDQACRAFPAVRALIDDTMSSHRQNMEIACNEVSKAVAQGRKEFHGRAMDRAAAEHFLSRRCPKGQS